MMSLHVNGNHTPIGMPAYLVLVDPKDVDNAWPLAAHWLVDGMLACGEDLDEVYTIGAVRAGHVQLWLVHQGYFIVAAMTSRFWPSRSGRVCHLTVGGGMSMETWLHLSDVVEQYAKSNGCSKVRFAGRNGWERKLTNYRRVGVILERELS